MTQSSPSVSRKEAAKILNVSTRTLDRYIRQQKISTLQRGRNITFALDELRAFQQKRDQHIQPELDINENTFIQDLKNIDTQSQPTPTNSPNPPTEEKIYKNLYEETSREIKKKDELLQGANYRVGQLEAKLQNMVPLLEFKKQKEETDQLRKDVEVKETVCQALNTNIQIEKFNKKIFTILFFLSLSLFPILLVIHLLSI